MSARFLSWSLTFLLLLSLALTFELPARAYTDPGSCLLLFQSAGAIASGMLFYFRRQIKRLFTRAAPAKPARSQPVMSRTAA